MGYLFFSFWWLIFPIMGFGFGAFGMWMSYLRERHRLELMKTYAQQGKDPAEVAKLLGGVDPGAPGPTPPPYDGGYGYGGYNGYWGGYWGPRRWRYGRRWGPYREWRNFVVFLCLAVGFGMAAEFGGIGDFAGYHGRFHPFILVAIIMSVLAMGSLIFAVISTIFALRSGPNDR
jgi:hypothetical protein